MQLDLFISGGHVVDPSRSVDAIADIGVIGNKIVDITGVPPDEIRCEKTVDARGLYVFPGLIDFHTHLFSTGSTEQVNPGYLISNGVTATVDGGTAGCLNFPALYSSVLMHAPIRVKSYVNAYSAGLMDAHIQENYELRFIEEERIVRLVERYRDMILGLKLRYVKGLATFEALEKTVRIARALGIGVSVHTTRPAGPLDQVADLLERDDIYTHVYQNLGDDNILCGGAIKPSILRARERGVIFDMANGKFNFSFDVALKAMELGFAPDVISTDQTMAKHNHSRYVKNLPNMMAKFLEMGMPLNEVVRAVTQTPARLMQMEGQIGTLAPGSYADIAVFQLINQEVTHIDVNGGSYVSKVLPLPKMTVCNGEIGYCQGDFAL